jgi:hypothetical protein
LFDLMVVPAEWGQVAEAGFAAGLVGDGVVGVALDGGATADAASANF